MDAADLAVFAAVARVGGIGRAALELHTVQSNVTRRIRLLEEEVEGPLFNRHSRGVSLTAAGARLLPYAGRIAHLLDEARRAAMDGPVPSGPLHIGSLETTTALRLPPILTAYAKAFPKVDIQLETGMDVNLKRDVLERRLEGAFVVAPVKDPDLVYDPIVEEELVLVTAPWMRDPTQPEVPGAARADGIKIVVFRAGCSYRQTLERLLSERGHTRVKRLEFGTLDGIIGCVGAGVGITMLPRAVVERARCAGQVAVHDLPAELAHAPTVFVRRRDAFVSSALARFLEYAQANGAPDGR